MGERSRVQGSHFRKTHKQSQTRQEAWRENVHNPRIASDSFSLSLSLAVWLKNTTHTKNDAGGQRFFFFWLELFFFFSFCLSASLAYLLTRLFPRKHKDWFIIILTYNDALLRCCCFLSHSRSLGSWYRNQAKAVPRLAYSIFHSFLFVVRKICVRYTFFPPSQ